EAVKLTWPRKRAAGPRNTQGGRRDGERKSSPARGGGPREARWRGLPVYTSPRDIHRPQAAPGNDAPRSPAVERAVRKEARPEVPQAASNPTLRRRLLLCERQTHRRGRRLRA